jgi:hypothetical protein
MSRIRVHELRIVRDGDEIGRSCGSGERICLIASQTVNLRVQELKKPKHVVEGTILHHKHNYSLDGARDGLGLCAGYYKL